MCLQVGEEWGSECECMCVYLNVWVFANMRVYRVSEQKWHCVLRWNTLTLVIRLKYP